MDPEKEPNELFWFMCRLTTVTYFNPYEPFETDWPGLCPLCFFFSLHIVTPGELSVLFMFFPKWFMIKKGRFMQQCILEKGQQC